MSCWHWKRSRRRRRLSLNFLYLPTDISSKRSSVVIDPLLVTVINQRDWFLSQKRRLDIDTTPRQTWPQTILPPTCPVRDRSPFLKVIYSPLRGLYVMPLSLLRWYLKLNSQEITSFFFWVFPMMYTRAIHVNKLLFFSCQPIFYYRGLS